MSSAVDEYRVRLSEEIGALKAAQGRTETAIAEIATDVKSLLDSRSFTRGVWKTAATVATVTSAIVGLVPWRDILAWLRGH